jgi:predicted nucleic acid-binding protein
VSNGPERPVAYVLDRRGLLDYADEASLVVPSLLASARERDRRIAVSALAVGEAYVRAGGEQADRLDLLTGGDLAALLLVATFDKAVARAVGRGGDAARGERDLARLHMAALAREHDAIVVTGEVGPVRDLLGPDWTIIKL